MTHKPRIAVVGSGRWGRNLVRNFQSLHALDLVCDISEAARSQAQELAPNAALVADFRRVLSSNVDAVVIATPAESHYELARQAIEAGKDVFVEKPLALCKAEGLELVKMANRYGRILMVGHVTEYHPAISRLRDLVASGKLGDLYYLHSSRLSAGTVRQNENILWSFAPHDIAVMLRLFGTMPLEVATCGGGYVRPEIADITTTDLLFENGARAHIHVSWLHPFKEHRLTVLGSRGTAAYDDVSRTLVLYQGGASNPNSTDADTSREVVTFPSVEPLRCECEAFLEAVHTRKPPLTDGASALRVLEVLEAGQESLRRNGEPVELLASS